jgi:diguanylate cyclase
MNNRTTEETLSLLSHMILHHKIWFNAVIRELICQIPTNQKECLIYSGMIELDNLHQKLHQQEREFSHLYKNKNTIECAVAYDKLVNILEQFNSTIYALQKELEISTDMPPAPITATMITILPILREQQSYAKRQFHTCHISLVNVDLLNKIQDEYGSVIKEKILITVAQLLVEHLRTYDKVFCYNNETFLVSLQNINSTQALDLIDRLRIKISKTPINIGLNEPLYITVSCGISALDPAFTIEQSLEQANLALYLAKKSGRNNTKSWGK